MSGATGSARRFLRSTLDTVLATVDELMLVSYGHYRFAMRATRPLLAATGGSGPHHRHHCRADLSSGLSMRREVLGSDCGDHLCALGPERRYPMVERSDLLSQLPPTSTTLSRPVLVTGTEGFIGRHLRAALVERNVPVIGVDTRCPEPNDGASLIVNSRLCQVKADLTTMELSELSGLLAQVGAVVHLAAATDVAASWDTGFADHAASVLGTQRLLRACQLVGVPRVVLASSSHVYGPGVTGPVSEDAPTEPTSPYGVAKLAAERLALAYARHPRSTMSVVALRFFTAFGPGCRPAMVINRMFTAAVSGQPLPLYGTGTVPHTWTYVSDLVEATLAAIAAPLDAGQGLVVNAAGSDAASLRQVAERIGDLVGAPVPLRKTGDRAGDAAATRADLTRAALVLRWFPKVGLDEGLRRQWQHLRKMFAPSAPPDWSGAAPSRAEPSRGGATQ